MAYDTAIESNQGHKMIKEIFSTIAYEVQPNKTAALRVGRSQVLSIEAGTVWLTRSDDQTDYWLDAGTSLSLRAGETLWLSAEAQSARVVFKRPARCDKRIMNWLASRWQHRLIGQHPALV